MKKFDEPNNRLKENSALAAYGLRRLNVRQGPVSSCTLRSYQGTENPATRARPQNGKILDSWYSTGDSAGATYFWNPDDVKRAKNDINSPRNIGNSGNFGTNTVASGSLTSGSMSYNSAGIPTQQKPQKIIPSGYAPNRFPVSVSYTARPCWPKTYSYVNSSYSASSTSGTPPVKINGAATASPSTSAFSPSSATTECIIFPKPVLSSTSNGTSILSSPNSIPRRFENGTTTAEVITQNHVKSRGIGLKNGFFRRKLSISKRNGCKESTTLPRKISRQQQTSGMPDRKANDFGSSSKREAPLIWSVPANKDGLFLFSGVSW